MRPRGLRPVLSTMNNAENLDTVFFESVDGKIRQARKDEFAGLGQSPCPAELGVLGEETDTIMD